MLCSFSIAENLWRSPQLQFSVKVICPLLFRLVLLVRQRRKLWIFCSCRSSLVVDFPFVPRRQIPIVLPVRKTIETPQLQYVSWWSMPLLCRSCLLCALLFTTGAHGSDSAEICGGSAVAVPPVVDVAVLCSDKLSRDSEGCHRSSSSPESSGLFSRHRDRYAQFLLCMVGGGGDEG